MARGEGAEQFSSGLLPTAKTVTQDGIKTAKLSPQQERKRALTVWSKVCFAIGGAPYQITGTALGFFLQIFLLDVALLDPLNASVILFVGRAWDAVTDPTVGFLVSRTPWTRHGRMMPWILVSTIPAVLCYFLIWVVPPIEQGKMLWYLLFYCLFQTLQTCFHVPYSALTMFISNEQKERDSATAYRMTVEVLGTVIGTAVQGQIVGMANVPCTNGTSLNNSSNNSQIILDSKVLNECFHVPYSALTMFISNEQKERDSATAYRMTVEVLGTVIGTAVQGQIVGMANVPCTNGTSLNNSSNNSQIILDSKVLNERRAFMIASAVISLIYVLCAVVLFFGVREQDNQGGLKAQKHVSFQTGLRLVMGHGPYVKLVLAFLFTSLAFMLLEGNFAVFIKYTLGFREDFQNILLVIMLLEGNFAVFIKYTLGFREDFQNILLVIMLSATLTIPMWQWFLCRFGKKTAVYIGIPWAVPFMILVVCVNNSLFVSYVVSIAAGASVAAAFLLPWSMLPDVVDDFKVQNPTSQGHEAIFYSFYVFFTKFASGVSLGVSTLALSFAGYETGVCVQPDSVNLTLKMLVSAAPVSLIALGLLIFKTYPINEERRKYNNKQLQLLLRNEEQESEMEALKPHITA
ncbi:sodium-dependent lysophosphatidylcholine symporter 1-A [Labeo rohita]|uniref:Sodium-dependent lysophosphatidylcholine symporter 1-A n=1 Tax=Labeo rohita TaxID=84645 RepID=A0A498L9V3_LABRO|nr:sodium-dependent lysophosphatidylcholine symporter 1-A [Labeo rohita]